MKAIDGDFRCRVCKKEFQDSIFLDCHCIDGNHYNKSLSNIIVCCRACHRKLDIERAQSIKDSLVQVEIVTKKRINRAPVTVRGGIFLN